VLELGCGGLALGSIAAAKLGARLVVATDGDPVILELAYRNMRANLGIVTIYMNVCRSSI